MQGMTGKAPRARKPMFFKGVVLGAVTSMLVLSASTAFATHAGVFTLGHTNTVDATSLLTGSASQLLHVKNTKSDTPAFAVHAEAQGPDPAMRVTNTGTGPGLGITVAPGVPPIRTFSTAKVNNLNVDLLDGQEAAAFLPAAGKAVDADLLDGLNWTAFLRPGSAAGGRLSGTYPNPTIPGNSLTGSDIDESTLAAVPNASSVDGQSAATFNFKSIGPESFKTLVSLGGLTIRAQCVGVSPGTDRIDFRASTTAENSFIWSSIASVPANGDWDGGNPSGSANWFTSTSDNAGVIVYRQGDTAPLNAASVVTVNFAWRTTNTSCETVGSAVGH